MAGSISKEADIRISQIKVGNVVKSNINPETYLKKNGPNKERHETSSQYNGSNLYRGPDGGRYVHLQTGSEEHLITPGGEIHTQNPEGIVEPTNQLLSSPRDRDQEPY